MSDEHLSADKPIQPTYPSEQDHIQMMLRMKRIAVVGLSDDPSKPSFQVASYLLAQGKEIIPVNPNVTSVFGIKSCATLAEIPGEIELVNVFRRSEACAEVAAAAIARGARGIWLQSGVKNAEARALAQRAKIHFTQDRCLMVEHLSHRTPEDYAKR